MGTTTLLLLSLASLFLLPAYGQTESKIFCTAGNFTKCQSARITCHFNQDIKVNKRNFNVVQYAPKNGAPSNDAGNYVLVCNWGEGDSLQCKVEEGYYFDKQVSDTLTLGIPDVRTSVAGVYVCQMVPDGGVPLETCALNVLDVVQPAAGGFCPTLTCPDSSSNQGILIAVLVFVLIVLILLAVFVGFYIGSHCRLEWKTGDPAHDKCILCGLTPVRSSHKYPSEGHLDESDGLLAEGEAAPPKDLSTPAPASPKGHVKQPAAGNSKDKASERSTAHSNTHQTQGADGITERPQPLQEEESDTWTVEQVGQWLRKEGFGTFAPLFKTKGVDGKGLLGYKTSVGLMLMGMKNSPDRDDRQLLLKKTARLKDAVRKRKERPDTRLTISPDETLETTTEV